MPNPLGTSAESAAGCAGGTRAVLHRGTGFPLGTLALRLCGCAVPTERCQGLEAQRDAEVRSWSWAPCTELRPGELLSWEAADADCREGLAEAVRGTALVVPHCPQTRLVSWGASLADAGMDVLQEPRCSPLPGSGRASCGFRMLLPTSSRVSLQSLHQAITKCHPTSPFIPFPHISNALGAGSERPRAAKSSCQLGSANPRFSAGLGAARPAAVHASCRGGSASAPARGGSAGSWADGSHVRRVSRARDALRGWRGSLPPAGEGTRFRKWLQGCGVGVIPAALSDSRSGLQPRWRARRGDGCGVCSASAGRGSRCPGLGPVTCGAW